MDKKYLFGFEFVNCDSLDRVVDYIFDYKNILMKGKLREEELPFVITPNVDQLVKYDSHNYLKKLMSRSFLVLPDGQPIIWISKILNKPLSKRLTGSDLFPILWERIIKEDKIPFFILPYKEIGFSLTRIYNKTLWEVAPIFNIDELSILRRIAKNYKETIVKNNVDFVLIGIGFPKRELLALFIYKELIKDRKFDKKHMPIFLLLGAAFEFFVGTKKRAPKFFRSIGAEWFFRFLMEPRRLFKRYFIEDLKFLKLIFKEIVYKTKRRL